MKNFENIETVDKSRHAKLRVKDNPGFEHARELNLAGVTMSELSACTNNFPVVFVEHPDNKQMRPVAMLGLRPGENVYYAAEGWDSTYVPMMIQRHPFIIGFDDRIDDDKQLATCLQTKSPFLSESEGIAMFKDNGEETDYMQSRHMLMREIFEGEKVTEQFMGKLQELNLLVPLEILLQLDSGEVRRVSGMSTLSEPKLRALTAEQVAELHKLDLLPACYLILASFFQIHKLMRLRGQKGIEKVTDYRIDIDPKQQPEAKPQS